VTSGCWSSFKDQIATQAFAALAPGGYFESQELDASVTSDDGTLIESSPLTKWCRNLTAASEACHRPLGFLHRLKAIYEEVGFVDVQQRVFKVPTNGWPLDERLKELGKMWERNLSQGLSGFSFGLFNRVYGWTPEQIEVRSSNGSDCRLRYITGLIIIAGDLSGCSTRDFQPKSTRLPVRPRRLGEKTVPRRGKPDAADISTIIHGYMDKGHQLNDLW
jgi:hypothetical protein